MVVNCCVPTCSSRAAHPIGVTFHEIPSDEGRRSIWLKNIKRGGDWTPSGRSVVCSIHFDRTCFKSTAKIRCLKKDAIPTIFPNSPNYLKVKTVKRKVPPNRLCLPVEKKCATDEVTYTETAEIYNPRMSSPSNASTVPSINEIVQRNTGLNQWYFNSQHAEHGTLQPADSLDSHANCFRTGWNVQNDLVKSEIKTERPTND